MKMPNGEVVRLVNSLLETEESYLWEVLNIMAGVLRKRIGPDRWAAALRDLLATNAAYRAMEEACDDPR